MDNTFKKKTDTRLEMPIFSAVREVLRNNYWSRNLIGLYRFWVISPRNSTRPFLAIPLIPPTLSTPPPSLSSLSVVSFGDELSVSSVLVVAVYEKNEQVSVNYSIFTTVYLSALRTIYCRHLYTCTVYRILNATVIMISIVQLPAAWYRN